MWLNEIAPKVVRVEPVRGFNSFRLTAFGAMTIFFTDRVPLLPFLLQYTKLSEKTKIPAAIIITPSG
jgi:hypothetical protein